MKAHLYLATALVSAGPAAAQTVQINLNAPTGQVVAGTEFGLATTMGDITHDYLPYGDPALQAVANRYPTSLLRHNWELHTQMDVIYPSRESASSPNFTDIDHYLSQQGNLKGFFNNQTGTQIVTLGFPSWLNIGDPSDQTLYAGMVRLVAQHFIAAGEPIHFYELVNEPDGAYSVTDMSNTFNVVAQALKSLDSTYKLGGLTETFARTDDLRQFFRISGPNIGFVSWHQYVTNGSDGQADQDIVTNGMTRVEDDAKTVRGLMRSAGIPDSVPMFLGEYNVNGAIFDDPNNGNMVGAVSAAAVTYGMIASNTNMTMGALWCVENGSAYSVFGGQGNYQVDPIGVVLSDLTHYMPGNLVQTTMPSSAQGLVGYTTGSNQGFSTALINTNLSQSYTVDLDVSGTLPTAGLFRFEVSPANPLGAKTALTRLSNIPVPAGSVVIVTGGVKPATVQAAASTPQTPPPTPPVVDDLPPMGPLPPLAQPSPEGTSPTLAPAAMTTAMVTSGFTELSGDAGNHTITVSNDGNVVCEVSGAQVIIVSGDNNAVDLGPYDDSITITGTGNTVNAGGGVNNITLSYSGTPAADQLGNIIVLPSPGTGEDVIAGKLRSIDRIDLTQSLAGTMWDHTAATMANFYTSSETGAGYVITVAGKVVALISDGVPGNDVTAVLTAH